ncbi:MULTISPECIES: DEAD/DEAH box helicase [Turicibacter]|uniref:ATP-dependent RNA helicase CshA n=4 Tax=Turicibacter sanguinis TaxID=154288 RepID=A0A173S1I3_9FIRM|nr:MULTISPECIES: DEAD/DEAH box helicase [Turicibacter]EFF63700.1 putative ATP-dependent RNA helicase DeaD [Turicibacter sanguinis PC909]EGC92928.1 DEAD-box ATP-dependent RNA helicase CshA [Turicibacter sp. HGF1]MBP3903181.1 DEAD/DEAH box helicase [Turicibacter sp.]MCU7191050.1 DEAD/DEAH box helicase [Turicibacter sanguinis]MCU7197940.1 DEAD/DEAH box helicase [Turicibacter sanguinis]
MTEITFKDLALSPSTLKAIEEIGYVKPSPIQAEAIPVVLAGKDIIGQAQTGTGKTAAFMLPILEKIDPKNKNVQALVLCPTRELAVQVHEESKKFSRNNRDVHILSIYGGQSYDPQIRALKKGVQIVVGTPGRVMDHMRRGTLKLENLKMLVLDEADEMLNMGFKDDIEEILEKTPESRQTVMFSATMAREIMNIAKTYQKNPEVVKVVSEELSNKKIDQYYVEVKRQDRVQAMIRCIDMMGLTSSIVFTNTKREVDELVSKLQEEGYVTEGLHGDLKQAQRDRVMNSFRRKNVNILVATDIAARGIDVSNVEAVFNYDIPLNEENYVHRIGRTGRAGMTGLSITFVFGKDMFRIRRIEDYTKTKMSKMPIPSVEEIQAKKSTNVIDEIVANLEGKDFSKENELIAAILEKGFTIEQVAAGLLQMKIGQSTKKYAHIEEVTAGNPKAKGMRKNEVRLFVNVGSKQKVKAKDFVGMLTKKSDIPARAIGDIDVYKKFTFINVDKAHANNIIRKLNSKLINGKPIRAEKTAPGAAMPKDR